MAARRKSTTRLATHTTELALAAPRVMAHRLSRMALAGTKPNARDRREFHLMAHEKVVAFWQSWMAMSWTMVRAMQAAWLAALRGAPVPMLDPSALLAAGLAPVHRKATANARRLMRLK